MNYYARTFQKPPQIRTSGSTLKEQCPTRQSTMMVINHHLFILLPSMLTTRREIAPPMSKQNAQLCSSY